MIESMTADLIHKLKYVLIGAIIFYTLCIWEFTLGIFQTVKKFFVILGEWMR